MCYSHRRRWKFKTANTTYTSTIPLSTSRGSWGTPFRERYQFVIPPHARSLQPFGYNQAQPITSSVTASSNVLIELWKPCLESTPHSMEISGIVIYHQSFGPIEIPLTGDKPSFLLYGIDCHTPMEAALLPPTETTKTNVVDYRSELISSLSKAR